VKPVRFGLIGCGRVAVLDSVPYAAYEDAGSSKRVFDEVMRL